MMNKLPGGGPQRRPLSFIDSPMPGSTRQPVIVLDSVTVRVGDRWLLNGLSWQINRGENWVIWGANGVGKSTLARTLMGDTAVVAGSVHRFQDEKAMALISSEQHLDIYEKERWIDEMAHFSGRLGSATTTEQVLDKIVGREDTGRAEIEKMLGLEPFLPKPVTALSAGEVRKLLIARALMRKPSLLILDEPFTGLDSLSQSRLLDILDQLGASGMQMVLITHRPADIAPVFTHLIHLKSNEPPWQGSVASFMQNRDKNPAAASGNQTAIENQPGPSCHVGGDSGIALVQMKGVTVRYGRHPVLTDITWTMYAGENWALIGPNGAGKSTLLKLITGDHLQGYANDLILFGRPRGSGESIWQIKQYIGYVADDLQLRYQKKMSGFDVVCSGLFRGSKANRPDVAGENRHPGPCRPALFKTFVRSAAHDPDRARHGQKSPAAHPG